MKTAVLGWLLAGLACGAIYASLWTEAPKAAPDTKGYQAVARDLCDGILENPNGRTPGLPLLMLLTGSQVRLTRALFFLNVLFHVVSVLTLQTLLLRCGLSNWFLLYFWFLAWSPPFTRDIGWALTETPTQFFVVLSAGAAFVAFQKESLPWSAVSGLGLSAAALTRPSFAFAGLVAVAVVTVTVRLSRHLSNRILITLTAASAFGAIILLVHNGIRFGYWGVSPRMGIHLTGRLTDLYPNYPDGPLMKVLVAGRAEMFARGENRFWTIFHYRDEIQRVLGRTGLECSRYLEGAAVKVIREHPIAYFETGIRSLPEFWMPGKPETPFSRSEVGRNIWYCVGWLLFLSFGCCVGVLSVDLLWRVGLRKDLLGLSGTPWLTCMFCLAIVGYNCVVNVSFDAVESRFRRPTDLIQLLVLTIVVHRLWTLSKETRQGCQVEIPRKAVG